MSMIGIILLSIAVIGVTVFLFVGWVIFNITRALLNGFFPGRPRQILKAVQSRFSPADGPVRCSRENCRNFNPPNARFCRCCGTSLQYATAGQRGRVRNRMTA